MTDVHLHDLFARAREFYRISLIVVGRVLYINACADLVPNSFERRDGIGRCAAKSDVELPRPFSLLLGTSYLQTRTSAGWSG